MRKRVPSVIVFLVFIVLLCGLFIRDSKVPDNTPAKLTQNSQVTPKLPKDTSNPLSIDAMRAKKYPGSTFVVVQTLTGRRNYARYIVSYLSDGLTQYGLLTVPLGNMPVGGWPAILFNHGYIPPGSYSTVESYASYVDVLASSGFVVFKPDYRGNANSQGVPVQPYVSGDYVTDSMNALSSLQKDDRVNSKKIGVFGHSMGGNISLHELVISKDFSAAVLFAGSIGDEAAIIDWWDRRFSAKSIVGNDLDTYYLVKKMEEINGTPNSNEGYWNSIDPTKYISTVSAPIQIQVGTADTAVPVSFSTTLRDLLKSKEKAVEFYEYPGIDHNFSGVTSTALGRAVSFYEKYLK